MSSSNLSSAKQNASRIYESIHGSQTRDEALETAIKAAEASMHALKLADDSKDKSELSASTRRLLDLGERIKSEPDWRAVIQSLSPELTEPVSTRQLTKKEQILLLRSGFLHGFKFPPWSSTPDQSEFELSDSQELFIDSPDLVLSEFQEDVLDDWKRPAHALPPPSWPASERINTGPTMNSSAKVDLVQDASTDCSVVASLCATVSRLERGYGKISKTLLCPYDLERDHPIMSPNGKYISRLNFNGCFRKVIIDDRLPTSSTSRAIHMVDRANPGLLWPALIEKAYLKVRGGYDFPGSNSGTDLWILTGWIPEQVFLSSDELDPEDLWQRIFTQFDNGVVLITMGTGKMSTETEGNLGLAGEHDYAVLDLKEVDGQRLLLIKNPWCESTSWRARTVVSEDASDTSGSQIDDPHEPQGPVQSPRDLLNANDELSPGTFWMDIHNVMQHFQSIYLNWHPGLFSFRQDIHFAWDLSSSDEGSAVPRGRFASLFHRPQFEISSQQGGTMWILLCRHFSNAIPADATDEEIQAGRYGIVLKGHMSLIAFSSGGKRVLLPESVMERGWLVDSPQTLLKLENCAPNTRYTLVPTEEELASIKHTFTIAAFANSPMTLEAAKPRFPHATKVSGKWSWKISAGGNANSPTYSCNPQFSISVAVSTRLSLLLESMNDEYSIQVRLVHGGGKRVHRVRNRDIIIDSKDYRRGSCVAELNVLEPGKYTIICSTFEADQEGDFNLIVESSHPAEVSLLPGEHSGRPRIELNSAVFSAGQTRLGTPIAVSYSTRMYAVAQRVSRRPNPGEQAISAQRSPVRLKVEIGRLPHLRQLNVSNEGEYLDLPGGIRTDETALYKHHVPQFGDYWLILERLPAGSHEADEVFTVTLYFDDRLDALVDKGDWRVLYD